MRYSASGMRHSQREPSRVGKGMSMFARSSALVAAAVTAVGSVVVSGQLPSAPPQDTLADAPQIFDSSTRGPSGRLIVGLRFRVVPMKGLSYPYALAFLPGGNILITERAGRLRIVRAGVLDPTPISGIPEVLDRSLRGLNDVALHPRFPENQWIYFTYYKPVAGSTDLAKAVLARGRFDRAHALSDVRD